jgi:hypothetical protein
LQPAEELDQKEWAAVHPFRLLQQLLVRLGAYTPAATWATAHGQAA